MKNSVLAILTLVLSALGDPGVAAPRGGKTHLQAVNLEHEFVVLPIVRGIELGTHTHEDLQPFVETSNIAAFLRLERLLKSALNGTEKSTVLARLPEEPWVSVQVLHDIVRLVMNDGSLDNMEARKVFAAHGVKAMWAFDLGNAQTPHAELRRLAAASGQAMNGHATWILSTFTATEPAGSRLDIADYWIKKSLNIGSRTFAIARMGDAPHYWSEALAELERRGRLTSQEAKLAAEIAFRLSRPWLPDDLKLFPTNLRLLIKDFDRRVPRKADERRAIASCKAYLVNSWFK